MNMILGMYITMMPVILAGILNMVFVKTPFYKKLKYPIDGGRCLSDGRRIFGDNKTYIGFFSMIVISIITTICWGAFCRLTGLESQNELYLIFPNKIWFNASVGAYFGLSYMLFELPNSFVKRRIDIEPGKTENKLFFVIDQIDSLFGVMLILFVTAGIPVWKYFCYILVGGFTHIAVNLTLYKLKIRRNL
ncbi:CDP-archaeol synthase [Oribacterium sp. P6A1]|uniref:CDP-archaeol synthase n=1 Tax=Oribacterium sp. P6A1 TaxID=1410612 RepID=UPI00055FCBD1|nr:CDP-archaeol synthase [Oribacterium sp. P6A1]